MATRNADVNLIVRARTEGEKAIAGLGNILETLFDEARGGTHDIAELGKTIGALDKAAVAIAGSMDKAGAAVDRQRASITESNAAYQALLRQQAEAQRVQQQLENFVGPRTTKQTGQYAAVSAEVERLSAAISNLFAKVTQQNTQLNGTQSALLNLASTSTAVAQGQAEAEARIELTTQALREQAAAAERVTDIQRRINDITGVNRPDAAGSAARVADILAAADAEFRRLEAVRAEAEAQRALNNQLAERANLQAAIERNTGDGRVRAADAGATFSALADRERAAEQAEREAKAERELADAARAANSVLAERAQIQAAIARNTGDGRTRAVDSGATISALTELVNKEHEAAEGSNQMDKEAAQLRATLDPLAAIQERFNTALERYRTLAAAGKIKADELAAAEAHLAAEAEKARAALANAGGGTGGASSPKLSLFGLKPYELQNLSYQVNDVVTGLASGQHATQIIAQQGGQILQLFPKVAGNLIGALKDPRIAALVVTVGTLVFALKEAADQAARLREYASQTTFRADGGSYDPAALASAEEGLKRIGAKATEAREAVKTFLSEGINPDLLQQFGRAAQETAEVMGIKLPDAARQIAEAFTGGYKAVAELDDKLGFLTASEREHIKQLFDQGNAEAARTKALNAYTRQADAAAAKQRGPWGEAARSLGNAWDALIKYIANSLPIKATIAVLAGLAGAVKAVGDAITGALGNDKPQTTGDGIAANIARVQDQIRTLKKEIADYEDAIAKKSPISGTLQRLVDQSKAQLAAAEQQLAALEKKSPDTLNDDPNGTTAKKRAERLSDIDAEQQLQALRQRGQQGLITADSRRREQLAGELAYRQEMASTGDAIVANRLREIAVAKETAEVDKQNEQARKAAAADREREIRQFEGRVVGAEGGAGKNPYSTAKGYGQFTERTFLNQFKTVFPGQSDLGRDQILALRQNEQVARAVIDNYARENARFLESFGAKVTAGNLYLAHFLGAGGAKAVLTAPGDKPVDQILRGLPNVGQVLSGNQAYLRTDGGKGRYRTSSELQAFISNRVGDTGQAQTQGQAEINNLLDEARLKQDEFNLSIQHGAEDRQRVIDALKAEAGLHDTALLAEQRRQAVLTAELDLRQKVEDANKNLKPGETPVVVSQEQIDKAKELAGVLFDVQQARAALEARLGEAQRPLDTLEQQRDLLIQNRDLLISMGEFKAADQVQKQIDALGGSITSAYDKLIEFYKALSPEDKVRLGIFDDTQLDNIIKKLELAKDGVAAFSGSLLNGTVSYRSFLDAFASSAVDAFTGFIQNVAAGQNVFKSFGKAILQFAASFASALAQMILKTLAFVAALYVLSAITHIPVQVLAAGAQLGASVHHTGGIAGQAGGARRSVAPAMFAAAMRYHTGGIVGLAPDEVPAILKQGEEVLTQGDPRHRGNGGLGTADATSGKGNVTVIQVTDPAQALEQALRTPAGEKVIINHVRENQAAFKAALG